MTDIFLTDDTLVDRLIEHFNTGGKANTLSPKEQQQWEVIDTMQGLLGLHRKNTAINLLRQKYPAMTVPTAYRYAEFSERILGAMQVVNRDYWRAFILEKLMAAHDFAKQKGDARAMVAALDKAGKYAGLDREETTIDPSKLQRHNNVIVFIGGGNDAMKQLTLPEIQKLPPRKQQKIIQQITEAMKPEDTDFIEDARKPADTNTKS